MTAISDTSTDTPLVGLVRQLADKRLELGTLKAELRNEQARFDIEHVALITIARTIAAEVERGEEQVRQIAAAVYATTGDPKPAPGIEVYQKRVYRYDPKAVLEWARTANRLFITETLNVKVVEAAIGSGADIPVPGTKLETEPAVRIATDLTKALGEGAGAA